MNTMPATYPKALLITSLCIALVMASACGNNIPNNDSGSQDMGMAADSGDSNAGTPDQGLSEDMEPSCLATDPADDADGDRIHDDCDACQGDDFSGDSDNDGVCDDQDACPVDVTNDSDGDGFCDSNDFCEGDDNADKDGDGFVCRRDCDDDDVDLRPDALWWPDVDGDGVGDADAIGVQSCERPEGHVNNNLDCEDSRSWVHPGAPEVCDGYDSDCDPGTPEEQGVVYARRGDNFINITADFDGGTPTSPLAWSSTRDDQIFFCGFDVSATFDIAHDIEVRFDQNSSITLDGVQGRPLFDVNPGADLSNWEQDASVNLRLSGLNIDGKLSTDPIVRVRNASAWVAEIEAENAVASLGSLVAARGSDVRIEEVMTENMQGPVVYFEGHPVPLGEVGPYNNLSIRDASFAQTLGTSTDGGVLWASSASSELREVEIDGASSGGTGGAVVLLDGNASLDTVTIRNTTANRVGALWAKGIRLLRVNDLQTADTQAGTEHGSVSIEESDVSMSFISLERGRDLTGAGLLHLVNTSGDISDIVLADGRTYEGTGLAFIERSFIKIENSIFTGGLIEYEGLQRGVGGLRVETESTVLLNNAEFYGNEGMLVGGLYVRTTTNNPTTVSITGNCVFHLNRTRNVGVGAQQNAPGAIRTTNNAAVFLQGCDMGDPNTQPYTDNSPDDIYQYTNNETNSYMPVFDYASTICGGQLFRNSCGFLNCGICEAGGRCYQNPVLPQCDVEAGLVDGDGDGISNAFDRCPNKFDFDDEDGDLVPCISDVNDGEDTCAPGEVRLANGACSDAACVNTDGECIEATSCLDLLTKAPGTPSGIYEIDVDGDGPAEAMRAYCDMETDGGGWTLALNYNRTGDIVRHPPTILHDRLPMPSMRSSEMLRRTSAWGHASNDLLASLQPSEVRFWGATGVGLFEYPQDADYDRYVYLFIDMPKNNLKGPVVHFKSDDTGCLSYLTSGTGSCQGLPQAFTPLEGHTSTSPEMATSFGADKGNLALVDAPFEFFESMPDRWRAGRAKNPSDIQDPPLNEPVWQKVWVR